MFNVCAVHFATDWQSPAITEKQAWLNHLTYDGHVDQAAVIDPACVYVGFPWASALDYIAKQSDPVTDFGRGSPLFELVCAAFAPQRSEFAGKLLCTVCQHIYWKKLIPVWEALNFKHVYCAHLTAKHQQLSPHIQFHPWPLYAVNAENSLRNAGLIFKPWAAKQYLCSFTGCVDHPYYRSDIRQRLRTVLTQASQNISFFAENDAWFFQQEVFGGADQTNNMPRVKKYNHVLSNSIFSLCPEGSGPNTIRLWESLAVGSIPVLFTNDWIAPQAADFAWDDISVTIDPDDVPALFDILYSIPKNRIAQMQLNCVNAYQQFRRAVCRG